jgi:hypothetical protein
VRITEGVSGQRLAVDDVLVNSAGVLVLPWLHGRSVPAYGRAIEAGLLAMGS